MENKNLKPKTVDEYIAAFPQEIQIILRKIRETIKQAAPDAQEKISYGLPTFYLKGNLVHFAAFSNHIGFYPIPSGIEHFKQDLAPYKMGKGSIQFPLDQPIPYDLISRITVFRVQENLEKSRKKSNRK